MQGPETTVTPGQGRLAHAPVDHPQVRAPRVGVLLANLGTPDAPTKGAVRRYLASNGYAFPVSLDHDILYSALAARRVIPLTTIVDRQGRLKQAIPGEMFEEDVMELLTRA